MGPPEHSKVRGYSNLQNQSSLKIRATFKHIQPNGPLNLRILGDIQRLVLVRMNPVTEKSYYYYIIWVWE